MDVNGKWLMLVGEEAFDREHNVILDLTDSAVSIGAAVVGAVEQIGQKLAINLSPRQRLMISRFAEDGSTMQGMVYSSCDPLPDGDLATLWTYAENEEQNEVEEVAASQPTADLFGEMPATEVGNEQAEDSPICDPVFLVRDELADAMFAGGPSKYSTIDVSMYPFDQIAGSGFYDAVTDAEIDVALASLPLAQVVLKEPKFEFLEAAE